MLFYFVKDGKYQFSMAAPKFLNELSKQGEVEGGAAVSPMPGVVDKVFVKSGDTVNVGDQLLVIIAMKMEVSCSF